MRQTDRTSPTESPRQGGSAAAGALAVGALFTWALLLGMLLTLGAPGKARGDEDFLPVEQAFQADAEITPQLALKVNFHVAPQYSLYKDRITIEVTTPGVATGKVLYPASETHTDEFFGPQQVYTHDVSLTAPLRCKAGTDATLTVSVSYQGCADAGLCYPTQTQTLKVDLPDGTCRG